MLKRTIAVIGIIASIVGTTTISANAAWKKDNIGWWYTEGNSWAIGWRNIYGKWYYFDNNGYMKTGWLLDGGKWYYLNSNGVMLSNTVTEDGYTLNFDGSWNTSIPKKTNYSDENSLSNIVQSNVNIDEKSVYNNIIKMKTQYPHGMSWTNNNSYKSKVLGEGGGCAGFAFLLSDAAFGDLPAQKHTNFDNIRVGDILRINNDEHSVIVLEVKDNSVIVAEGNMNSSIFWGREISLDEIKETGTEVLTRYPSISTNNADKVVDKNLNNISNSDSNNINSSTDKSNNQNNIINDNSVSEDTISKEEFYNIVCDKMYELVNKHRKNNGVDKLKRDSGLDESAYLKSKHMMDNNYFDHDFKGKSTFELTKELWGQDIYGENIAMNYCSGVYTEKNAESLAENIFNQWKNSSGHNENMLRESFDTFGFGFVITKSNKVLATQQFGMNNSVNTNYSDYNTDDEVKNSSDYDTDDEVKNSFDSSGWKLMDRDGSNITVPDDGYEYSLEVKKTSNGSYYKLIKGNKKTEDKKQIVNNENNNKNNDKNEELNDSSISKIHGKSELKESIYEHFKNHDDSWELYYYGNSGDNKAEINDVLGDFLYKNNEFKQSIDGFGIGSGDDKTFFKITLYYK